jgi:hypothetical protein
MTPVPRLRLLDILSLREIRGLIRTSSARGGVVFFALLYVVGSLFVGGMLVLGNIPGGYTWTVLWTPQPGSGAWNFPGFLLVAPWGVVALPFFATLAMIVVGIGVGLGMTVAFLLVVRLLRPAARSAVGSSSASAVAGLTPAMISLVTLGACCSTTAAATAGVGLVANASGTSTANLLVNNWYLGVFQIAVVWVALIAQELLLVLYAGLFGSPSPSASSSTTPLTSHRAAGFALRVGLLVAGVLWSLSMLAEWTTISPAAGSAGDWFQWIVQHQVLAALAVAVALFPAAALRTLGRSGSGGTRALRAVLLVGGASLIFAPPPLAAAGLDGLVNQVMYVLGAPASWGAVSPGPVGGVALVARWLLEYALLAGSAIGVAVAPRRLLDLFEGPRGAPLAPSGAMGATPTTTGASMSPTQGG